MSSDGCQTPGWTGQSFAHLRYQPAPVSSYADARKAHAGMLVHCGLVALHTPAPRSPAAQMLRRQRLNEPRYVLQQVCIAMQPLPVLSPSGCHRHVGRSSTSRRPPCPTTTPGRPSLRPIHAVSDRRCLPPRRWHLCPGHERDTASVCGDAAAARSSKLHV